MYRPCQQVTKLGECPSAVQSTMSILSDMSRVSDDHWEPRVRLVLEHFLRAIQEGCDIPATVDGMILPLLRIIVSASAQQQGAPLQACAGQRSVSLSFCMCSYL